MRRRSLASSSSTGLFRTRARRQSRTTRLTASRCSGHNASDPGVMIAAAPERVIWISSGAPAAILLSTLTTAHAKAVRGHPDSIRIVNWTSICVQLLYPSANDAIAYCVATLIRYCRFRPIANIGQSKNDRPSAFRLLDVPANYENDPRHVAIA